MSECLSFMRFPWDWLRSISLMLFQRGEPLWSWSSSSPSSHVKLLRVANALKAEACASCPTHVLSRVQVHGSPGLLRRLGIYRVRSRKALKNNSQDCMTTTMTTTTTTKEEKVQGYHNSKRREANMVTKGYHKVSRIRGEEPRLHKNAMASRQMSINGSNGTTSLFTQKGSKQFNQDSMLLWEGFTSLDPSTVFCGVFDGHGPHGHFVSKNVRDILPMKLASFWETLVAQHNQELCNSSNTAKKTHLISEANIGGDADLISFWEESFQASYKMMDRELLIDDGVDCVSSGTTALTLVKQGRDMIIGNVGDSRAVLGMRSSNDTLVALQLTVDLTPNVPKEAERIRRRKGRVFALAKEPSVKRVWLPHVDFPGLAMSRALGDYSLKNYGVIAAPEVFYRQITNDDKFVVLATDGVWDVLSNEQVVQIVDSTSVRALAAKAVVDAAMKLWNLKYSFVKRDDCAVVCLFLD